MHPTTATAAGPSHTTPNPPLNAHSNRVADEGVAVTKDVPIQALFENTLSLLNEREFQSAEPRTFEGLYKRLKMMHDAGLPRMKLLPGKVLEELGRIPRSTELRDDGEPHTVDALEMMEQEMIEREQKKKDGKRVDQMPSFILAFFSHRWLRANYSTLHQKDVGWGSAEWEEARQADGHYVGMPDNEGNDKAQDLIEWMKWIRWRTEDFLMPIWQEIREMEREEEPRRHRRLAAARPARPARLAAARRHRRRAAAHPDKVEEMERGEGPDRVEEMERGEGPDRVEETERGEGPDRVEETERGEDLGQRIDEARLEDRRRRQTHLGGFLSTYVTRNCSDVYFFIDWSCVDQTNPVAEIAALPAFVSSCSMIASYWTEEYKGRCVSSFCFKYCMHAMVMKKLDGCSPHQFPTESITHMLYVQPYRRLNF
jgi:hypothetical protein